MDKLSEKVLPFKRPTEIMLDWGSTVLMRFTGSDATVAVDCSQPPYIYVEIIDCEGFIQTTHKLTKTE